MPEINPMNLLRIIKRLKNDEGIELNEKDMAIPYQDTKGIWAIGYGNTYIETPSGILRVTEPWKPISKRLAKKYLCANLVDAIDRAESYFNNFHSLDSNKQEALVNMCYQMGSRVKKFTETRKAVEAGLWGRAYEEMLNSKWAKLDSPNRAKRVAKAFLS